jgi:hypothetical protein
MVENPAVEADAGRKLAALVEILVHGIASSEQSAGDGDFVADLQRADGCLRNGCGEVYHKENGVMEWWSGGMIEE